MLRSFFSLRHQLARNVGERKATASPSLAVCSRPQQADRPFQATEDAKPLPSPTCRRSLLFSPRRRGHRMPEVPRGPTSCDLAFSPKRTPRPPFQERWTRGALARRRLYFWPLTPQEAAFVLGTSFTAALRRWVLALLVLLLHAYDLCKEALRMSFDTWSRWSETFRWVLRVCVVTVTGLLLAAALPQGSSFGFTLSSAFDTRYAAA